MASRPTGMRAQGWRCAVCSATVDIAVPMPWRCPNSSFADRHHVLRLVDDESIPVRPVDVVSTSNSFVAHDRDLAWAAYAAVHGLDDSTRRELVTELDVLVGDVAGTGFHTTPMRRSDSISDALGFDPAGGVWVKDETGGVAGSQKARHLFSILLHLRAAELLGHLEPARSGGRRPSLAIASCGNAALAAATLARAVEWPIDVYVPTWMSDGFGRELERVGARVHRCPRLTDDPPGDPAMFRFREAVEAGSVPFTVQGPENALALDGGRTIGWEIAEQFPADRTLQRVFVQVGSGAFATCVGDGVDSMRSGVRLHAVQTEGCAPLARAWNRWRAQPPDDQPTGTPVGAQWDRLMTVWDDPHSVADGILDDETYDWIGVFEAMIAGGGSPVVAPEETVIAAHQMARAAGYDVSATGSAGLAGLIALLADPTLADGDVAITPDERVVVVMSGVAR